VEVIIMGEHDVNIRPETPWEEGNCTIETNAPVIMTVSNVPMITVPEETATSGDIYTVRKSDHPSGLIVVPEHNKPEEDIATMPVIFTEQEEIVLPLNGWPRGGGVIFL
jgi:hypothetical protein